MPRPFVVPACKSNYRGTPYVSVFPFPKDPKRKELWIRKIHRKDFVPSMNSSVCINHFSENHIIRSDKFTSSTGENEFKWILGTELKCDRYSKLENLLVALANYDKQEISQTDEISKVIDNLNSLNI